MAGGAAAPVANGGSAKAHPAKSAAPAPAPASKLTGEAAELEKAIVAKGEEIRQLKASKADKAALEVRDHDIYRAGADDERQ